MRFKQVVLSTLVASSNCLVVPLFDDLWTLATRGVGSSTPVFSDPGPVRNVWVQFETALGTTKSSSAGALLAAQLNQAAYESGDFSTLVGGASIVVQGDGESNGNLEIQLRRSTIGGDRMTVQVTDYGLQNPSTAPETHIVANRPSFVIVHSAGTVQIDNEQILDTAGKGIATEIWSRNTDYHTWGNGPLSLVANVLDEIGAVPTDDVNRVLQNIITQEEAEVRSFVEVSIDNVPVQLVKYTAAGTTTADQDVWTFDVRDGANPQLVEQLKAGQPVDLTVAPPKQDFSARFNGITKQFADWSGLSNCFSGSCFSAGSEAGGTAGSESGSESGSEAGGIDGSEGGSDDSIAVSEFDSDSFTEDMTEAEIDAALDIGTGGDPGPSNRLPTIPEEEEIQPDEDWKSAEAERLGVAGSAEVAVVRTSGAFSMLTSFTSSAATTLGAVGIVAIAMYIILDIVLGEFKAAAFGAAGIVLGIGAGMMIAGPIGFLAGAAVAALFFFLPGLMKPTPSPAPTNNKTEILQFSFFGHRDHTGNEACNKKRVDAGLSPNCTVVYGAGVISHILNWDIFDAIIFLIVYNQGHAMSIPDIAEAFQVKDYTISGWGANLTATVDCGKSPLPPPPGRDNGGSGGRVPGAVYGNLPPSKGYPCHNATYKINRSLVTIPVINQTADQIYARVIPAPGGDCKLISDPSGGLSIPVLGLIITGRAVAIACNLTAADRNETGLIPTLNYYKAAVSNSTNSTSYSGTQLVPSNSTSLNSSSQSIPQNSTGNGTGSGIITTDKSTNRAYEPAPAAMAFVAYNSSTAACLTSPTGNVCLPNGTYAFMNGTLGFSTKGTTQLVLPALASLSYEITAMYFPSDSRGSPYAASAGDETQMLSELWPNNITIANKDFTSQITFMTSYMDGAPKNVPHNTTFDIQIPAPSVPPGVCLHAATQFLGDTVCFGIGGGNLTGSIVGKAQSLSLRGNASVWIYAESYDDLGGAFTSVDVSDLTELPWGSEKNFKNNIKAMWIRPP